jgi:hypothetical protein
MRPTRWLPVVLAALLGGVVVPRGSAGGGVPLQVPNLVPRAPSGLVIDPHGEDTGGEELRFALATMNVGDWALDLVGEVVAPHGEAPEEEAIARQCVRFVLDTGAVQCLERREVGTLVWHPEPDHQHWHFADFADYELRVLTPSGQPDMSPGGLVAASEKVSFCLLDSSQAWAPFVHTSDPAKNVTEAEENLRQATLWAKAFRSVPRNSRCPEDDPDLRQGISPGYQDVYAASTSGQSVPLGGVPDGTYALVVTVNPRGVLFEATRSDNTASVAVRIEPDGAGGRRAVVLP